MKICKSLKEEQDVLLVPPIENIPDKLINIFLSGGNLKIKSKSGNKIHIKKKNRGKFTEYCGGNVTSECIARAKRSGNPTLVKRATFAANARKWKHKSGGTIRKMQTAAGGTITAGQLAKKHLTTRKNPDWDNLDRGYKYLTQDMKLDHNSAIALMGNIVEESYGNYTTHQEGGGNGDGLIQWDGQPAPKGRYAQWGKVWASVAKRANVYDPKTKKSENYWKIWNGLSGDATRQKFLNPNTPIKLKTKIYSESYLRPGKPRMDDRILSTMQLDSVYNPKIRNKVIRLKK